MEIFKIEIIETLSVIVEVKAESEQQAIDIINNKYKNEEIVLDYSNYIDTEINCFESMN